jgi:hypothetical protein
VKYVPLKKDSGSSSHSSRTTGAFAAVALLILIPGGIYYARSRYLKKKKDTKADKAKSDEIFDIYQLRSGVSPRAGEDTVEGVNLSGKTREKESGGFSAIFADQDNILYGNNRIDIVIGECDGDSDDKAHHGNAAIAYEKRGGSGGGSGGGKRDETAFVEPGSRSDSSSIESEHGVQLQLADDEEENDDVASEVSDTAFHRVVPATRTRSIGGNNRDSITL